MRNSHPVDKNKERFSQMNEAGRFRMLSDDELYGAIKSKVWCTARKRHARINKRVAAAVAAAATAAAP